MKLSKRQIEEVQQVLRSAGWGHILGIMEDMQSTYRKSRTIQENEFKTITNIALNQGKSQALRELVDKLEKL